MANNLGKMTLKDSPVIRSLEHPVNRGGLAILRGNLATSAVVRPTVIPKRCFSIEAGRRCLMGKKRPWKPCSRIRFSRAMLSSFDMRAPGAVPVLQRFLRSLVI